jgi:hypothetical protein
MDPLERLLAPYRSAVAGVPTTSAGIAKDPLMSLLLPALGGGGGGGGGTPQGFGGGEFGGDIELLYGPNVPGHATHLHLAAEQGPLKKLLRQIQSMGFDVGEHPAFGGVDPVHTEGSWHYKGRGADVNYRGGGRWKDESQALGWLKNYLQGIL